VNNLPEKDTINLLFGDCLELMQSLPNDSIDMVLCDLPYGTTRNKWDSVLPLEELWKEYKRVCNGAIVLFGQTPFDKILGASNLPMLKYEWIWQKESGTGFLNAKKMPLKNHENILVFYDRPTVYNPQMREGFRPYTCKQGNTKSSNYGKQTGAVTLNNGTRYPVTILEFPRDKDKYHPTQKPVALIEYLIRTYSNENEVVLDNCMGSGTTAIACLNTNRRFIGMELNENYYQIARQRVLDWYK